MTIEIEKRLGFGSLRLPLKDPRVQESVDYDILCQMIDTYLERGFTYFDTSYLYHNFMGEIALRECLVKRHPRESFFLSDKLPIRFARKKEDVERLFFEQVEKCGVDYFDVYLIHSINKEMYENCKKWGVFEFLAEKQKEGYFKEFGVSLHDSAEFLEQILQEQPDINFVVLQINYLDWDSPSIQSKEVYEVARKYNKPIVVMEACKGGNLANIPPAAEKLMKDYNPDASVASWAYRFAGSLEGVRVVLSGNPEMAFLEDNMNTFDNFKPLNDEELEIIWKAKQIINDDIAIPCTCCRYCESKCPKKLSIGDYFTLYNETKRSTVMAVDTQAIFYESLIKQGHGSATDCIDCGVCEKACPQHLPIREYLKLVKEQFDDAKPPEGVILDAEQLEEARASGRVKW